MTAIYNIILTDEYGNFRAYVNDFTECNFNATVGDMGQIALSFMYKNYKKVFNEMKPDWQIQVWRKPSRVFPAMWLKQFFIRDFGFEQKDKGDRFLIAGHDTNGLLTRRIVAEKSGTTYSNKEDKAGTVIWEFFKEQAGSDAEPDRQLYGILSSAGYTIGPTIKIKAEWKNLVEVFQSVEAMSKTEGNEIFWELKPLSATNFSFIVKEGQLGSDKTHLTFSDTFYNTTDQRLVKSYSSSATYFYIGSSGVGSGRTVGEYEDTVTSSLSPWGRIESFVNFNKGDSDSGTLEDRAKEMLAYSRNRKQIGMKLVNTPYSSFGTPNGWNLGDKVTVNAGGQIFQALIRSYEIKLDSRGLENIQTTIEGV